MTLFLLLTIGLGCAPTCDQVCRKTLFDCDLSTERVALATCVDACDRQRSLYEDLWKDQDLTQKFADERRCLMRESCDDIADGVCYDPDVFIIDGQPVEEPFDPFAQ